MSELKWSTCWRCLFRAWCNDEGLCEYCMKELGNNPSRRNSDYYDEPMFYTCAMCGMEIIDYETVRGHKYCHSCAAVERHG